MQLVRVRRKDGTSYLAEVIEENPRLSYAKRQRLRTSSFACPLQRKYPINDAAHVRNALARYRQKRTLKCPGGLYRICHAAHRHGINSPVCIGAHLHRE
jgi:hypothetical protein